MNILGLISQLIGIKTLRLTELKDAAYHAQDLVDEVVTDASRYNNLEAGIKISPNKVPLFYLTSLTSSSPCHPITKGFQNYNIETSSFTCATRVFNDSFYFLGKLYRPLFFFFFLNINIDMNDKLKKKKKKKA